MPQIVFLSLFLGLVTGTQSVDLRVDPSVASVRIDLGGREVARLDRAPWSAKVNFGVAFTPGELTAIAYDVKGKEIARTSQLINLSRPVAEVELAIRSVEGRPVAAELVGRHRLHAAVRSASLTVDGNAVRVGRGFEAVLPPMDASRAHVLAAQMQFDDGEIARRDLVLQPGLSAVINSELTPLLVTLRGGKEPENLDGCFSAQGHPLRATAIEKGDALVVVVKDPDMREAVAGAGELRLDSGAVERILWPVSRPINAPGEPTAIAFPQSVNHGKLQTAAWLLSERLRPAPARPEPREFTDAVAVAAMSTLERGRRRAVILLLSNAADNSLYAPAIVRLYLEETGVPLFVWSAEPAAGSAWGAVEDVSTPKGLDAAVARLNDALAKQRIVWVAADPLGALHAQAEERCGLAPVARSHSGQL
jgi:hypothetical protein